MRGFSRAWIVCGWILSRVDLLCVDFVVRGYRVCGYFRVWVLRACLFFVRGLFCEDFVAWIFLCVDLLCVDLFVRGFVAWIFVRGFLCVDLCVDFCVDFCVDLCVNIVWIFCE